MIRIFGKIGWLFDVFEIRDFRNWIFARFASPRVRQWRRRRSPPSVEPAGSRPEAAGAFTPSWNSPAPPGTTYPVASSRPTFKQNEKGPGRPARSFDLRWWPHPERNRVLATCYQFVSDLDFFRYSYKPSSIVANFAFTESTYSCCSSGFGRL